MKVLGKVDASVNIDGLNVPYTFLVLEHLVHSVMFGIDILKFLQDKIDLHNNVITFADDLVCLQITKSSSNIVTARAVNTVVIPPCCEVVIPVHGAPVMLQPVPLSRFTFDIQYTPGTKLGNADAISRILYDVLNFKPPVPAEDVIEERESQQMFHVR